MVRLKNREERFFRILMLFITILTHAAAFLFFLHLKESTSYLERWSLPFFLLTGLSCLLSLVLGTPIRSGYKQVILLLLMLTFILIGYPLGSDVTVELMLTLNLAAMGILTFQDLYGEKIAALVILINPFLQQSYSLWGETVPGPPIHGKMLLFLVPALSTLSLILLHRIIRMLYRERAINQKYNRILEELTGSAFGYQQITRQNRQRVIQEEKNYITREIHDIISYTMTNQLMLIQAAQSIKDKNSPVVGELLEKANREVNSGMEKTRKALSDLRKQEPEPEDLNLLLESISEKFRNFSPIRIRIKKHSLFSHLSEETNQVLFHLVQQCMINTYLHSDADQIEIDLDYRCGHLVVSIKDNGSVQKKVEEGIGLKGMRERIEEIDGRMTIGFIPTGFAVTAEIPYLREEKV